MRQQQQQRHKNSMAMNTGGSKRRFDKFRSRNNSSRPPSKHVDDFKSAAPLAGDGGLQRLQSNNNHKASGALYK